MSQIYFASNKYQYHKILNQLRVKFCDEDIKNASSATEAVNILKLQPTKVVVINESC